MDSNILSLLGLCKRAGMLVCGEEPVLDAARSKDARLIVTAFDAADNTARYARTLAEKGACLHVALPFTKAQLGRALGRGVCAMAAVTDIGFAASMVGRMAAQEPERYGEEAQRLKLKAKRAAERKALRQTEREDAKKAAHSRRSGGAPPAPADPPRSEAPQAKKPGPVAGRPPYRAGGAAKRPAISGPYPRRSDGAPYPGRGKTPAGKSNPPQWKSSSPQRKSGPSRREDAPGTPQGGGHSRPASGGRRPFKEDRRRTKSVRTFPHSRPVQKGKGSLRKKDKS